MFQNRIWPRPPYCRALLHIPPERQPSVYHQNPVPIGSVERVPVAPNRRDQPAGLLLQPIWPRCTNNRVISRRNRNRVSLVDLGCIPVSGHTAAATCPL